MPAGTRIYAVRGYRTEFRLAAVWNGRIFLYQAWRNPRGKVGADLFPIAGKVQKIDVSRGDPTPANPPVPIASPGDVEAMTRMIVEGPMHRPSPHPAAEPYYWLTIWLTDETTLGRPYFVDSSELMGGVVLPPEFRAILERNLAR
ncbi:MAG TPA: hypothetical protein VJX92_25115 [Methylomirabilota bacterium]|nr:hypothetical protein [Methylomirabilota bacterium]